MYAIEKLNFMSSKFLRFYTDEIGSALSAEFFVDIFAKTEKQDDRR